MDSVALLSVTGPGCLPSGLVTVPVRREIDGAAMSVITSSSPTVGVTSSTLPKVWVKRE